MLNFITYIFLSGPMSVDWFSVAPLFSSSAFDFLALGFLVFITGSVFNTYSVADISSVAYFFALGVLFFGSGSLSFELLSLSFFVENILNEGPE